MPYGNFSTPISAYTKTVHTANTSSGALTYQYPDYDNYFSYSNPVIVRVGANTPGYHDPPSLTDFPNYEITSYRKLVGYVDRFRREYYWVKDKENPSISVRHFKRVPYKKKVFGTGFRFTRKKGSAQHPTTRLLRPNALTFIKQDVFCDKSVINLRQKLVAGGEVYYDNHIQFHGYPGEMVSRDKNGFPVYTFNGSSSEPFFPDVPLTSLPAGLADDCLAKLYTKVAEEFPDYLTDVIQVKSTWKTIAKIARTAIEVVYSMVRLDLKRLAGTLPNLKPRDISALWLEFIYGVSPVLDDIDKSIDLYMRDVRRWRTYSTSKQQVVEEVSYGSLGPSIRPIYSYKQTSKTTYIIRYGCIMRGDSSFSRKLRKDGKMSSAFATAYELVPYSFCIDWIYNLGDYLHSKDIMDDYLEYQWRTVLIKQEITREYSVNSYPDVNVVNEGDSFTIKGSRITMNRDPSITLPSMPVPKVKRFENVFSFKRALNALALFTQLVTRR